MQGLARLFVAGSLTLGSFIRELRSATSDHYVDLMLIALQDRELLDQDLEDLNVFINGTMGLIDGFEEKLEEEVDDLSEDYIVWRAGLYTFARHLFVRYSVPADIYYMLPEFPGISCLGDGACGCSLAVEPNPDGSVDVYWLINPAKESCVVCLDLNARWQPFTVLPESF